MVNRCCCCGAVSNSGRYERARPDVLMCDECVSAGPFCVEDVRTYCSYGTDKKLDENFPACPSCGFRLANFLDANTVTAEQWERIKALFDKPECERLARVDENWKGKLKRYPLRAQKDDEVFEELFVYYGRQWVVAYEACPNCGGEHSAVPEVTGRETQSDRPAKQGANVGSVVGSIVRFKQGANWMLAGCPYCQQHYKVRLQMADRVVTCKQCEKKFTMPTPQTFEDAEASSTALSEPTSKLSRRIHKEKRSREINQGLAPYQYFQLLCLWILVSLGVGIGFGAVGGLLTFAFGTQTALMAHLFWGSVVGISVFLPMFGAALLIGLVEKPKQGIPGHFKASSASIETGFPAERITQPPISKESWMNECAWCGAPRTQSRVYDSVNLCFLLCENRSCSDSLDQFINSNRRLFVADSILSKSHLVHNSEVPEELKSADMIRRIDRMRQQTAHWRS